MLMNKDDSILLIIDVQENLAPAQESPREVINGCAALLNVAKKWIFHTSWPNKTAINSARL